MSKKTLIIGASTNPERYSYKAAHNLVSNGHNIVQIGLKDGTVAGEPINTDLKLFDDIDTVTLYVGPKHQAAYFDYIIDLNPHRVVFNPGTENMDFFEKLSAANIPYEAACTLVLLATDQY